MFSAIDSSTCQQSSVCYRTRKYPMDETYKRWIQPARCTPVTRYVVTNRSGRVTPIRWSGTLRGSIWTIPWYACALCRNRIRWGRAGSGRRNGSEDGCVRWSSERVICWRSSRRCGWNIRCCCGRVVYWAAILSPCPSGKGTASCRRYRMEARSPTTNWNLRRHLEWWWSIKCKTIVVGGFTSHSVAERHQFLTGGASVAFRIAAQCIVFWNR